VSGRSVLAAIGGAPGRGLKSQREKEEEGKGSRF